MLRATVVTGLAGVATATTEDTAEAMAADTGADMAGVDMAEDMGRVPISATGAMTFNRMGM